MTTQQILLLATCVYLVVLAARNGYVILWTTFFVKFDHERRKFNRRYEAAKKS